MLCYLNWSRAKTYMTGILSDTTVLWSPTWIFYEFRSHYVIHAIFHSFFTHYLHGNWSYLTVLIYLLLSTSFRYISVVFVLNISKQILREKCRHRSFANKLWGKVNQIQECCYGKHIPEIFQQVGMICVHVRLYNMSHDTSGRSTFV